MIVEQGRHPRNESVEVGVVVETIPEDCFGGFGLKSEMAVAATGGDEIDGVVAIPMLEAMLGTEELFSFVGDFAEHTTQCNCLEY